MRVHPNNAPATLLCVIVSSLVGLSRGCFHGLTPLATSKKWIQATGVQAYLQYEAGGGEGNTISVIPRGRDMSGKITLTCLGLQSPSQALIQIQQQADSGNVSTQFQCLRLAVLSTRVLRIYRTEMKPLKKEANCGKDAYTPDHSVLVDASDFPPTPCPLQGSFQAKLSNLLDTSKSSSASSSDCIAKFHFNCNNPSVVVTFGRTCKPPVYKYNSNKLRYHSATVLKCVGDWSLEGAGVGDERGGSAKVIALRTNDPGSSSSSVWCFHYKNVNSSGENFEAYLAFDGRCASENPFIGNTEAFTKDTMHGRLASFVSTRDTRCSDKFYINQCRNRINNCSETNACPSECGRCYSIPKPDTCKFMPQTLGSWETVNSTKAFSVEIKKNGFRTSTRGDFYCRYSEDTTKFYTNPVVQYDPNNSYCMPVYACMQIYSMSPGVSTFYLRHAVSESGKFPGTEKPQTCDDNRSLFQLHPVPDGEIITLVDKSKLKPTPCDFGHANQFPTSRGDCFLNVEECSGKSCLALNVSFDNQTCHDNLPVLPIASEHECFANLKFEDGIRGLLTYSAELEKYACWIFTNTRLFVAEPAMCNRDAVTRVFTDKYASTKYDPLEAFLVPVKDVPSSSESSVPHFFLLCVCVVCSIVTTVTSRL